MKTVGVKHFCLNGEENSRMYSFKCNFDVKENDVVLCDTNCGLSLGRVVDIDVNYPNVTRYILSKIDLDGYYKGIEKEKQIKEVKEKMEERRKQLEKMEIYEILASKDETMAELLTQFKQLKG
jgi:hypothetical protein